MGGISFKGDVYIVVRYLRGVLSCTLCGRKSEAVASAIADVVAGGCEWARVDVYRPSVSVVTAAATIFELSDVVAGCLSDAS